MSDKESVYSKIQHLLAEEPSDWLADSAELESKAAWLKDSQLVAVKVLRRLREMGLTQNDLAEKIGVSRQQVNKWLQGRENFTFSAVTKLGAAVGMTLAELVQPLPKNNTVSVKGEKIREEYKVTTTDKPEDYRPAGEVKEERDIIPLNSNQGWQNYREQ